jgi:hypothetical protein
MRLFKAVLVVCWSAQVAYAEKMPALPLTVQYLESGTMTRDWAPMLWLRSELYLDRVGGDNVFYEVYFLRGGKRPIRLTLREAFGEEITIWTAPGYETP